jgi:NTE family protein
VAGPARGERVPRGRVDAGAQRDGLGGAPGSGGSRGAPRVRGFLDTQPLRELLTEVLAPVHGEITGIDYNLAKGKLKAVAIMTTSYTTGQTVVFLKGRDIQPWKRPQRGR